ncbi:IclR family transcriptional regulator [Roseibium aggregatum]|uniref:Helix-turn-helix domain-containing protein n=1 Tax=Roseibium aggregatum TaxID=187304 RepID=A0A939EHV9_9HYPH|nr:helix-turn-helix domain-containing protein [Roseibium aggregatum]MBN9672996.1 helix-turn-helix domain-containing protein [Roseibium aggregatum]
MTAENGASPETTKDKAGFQPVPAVVNAMRILQALSKAEAPIKLTEISQSAGVPIATALKILRTLESGGMVENHAASKTYQLGVGLLQLAQKVPNPDPEAALRMRMKEIATKYDCLTALWHITRSRVILRERALADRPLRLDLQVTQRMPVYLGAIGRIVAARRNIARDTLEDQFPDLRWEVPLTFERYWTEVQEAKELGYAIDAGNLYKGVHVVASVACDASGEPSIGLSAIALSGSLEPSRLAELGATLHDACLKSGGVAARQPET